MGQAIYGSAVVLHEIRRTFHGKDRGGFRQQNRLRVDEGIENTENVLAFKVAQKWYENQSSVEPLSERFCMFQDFGRGFGGG